MGPSAQLNYGIRQASKRADHLPRGKYKYLIHPIVYFPKMQLSFLAVYLKGVLDLRASSPHGS